MKTKRINFFKDKENNFDKFASDFLFEALKQIEITSFGKINIALSGGNTPLPILEILQKEKLAWDRFNFFMVDERCVPNDNPLSNFGNIQKVFFNQISSSKFSMVQDGTSYNESIAIYIDAIIKNVSATINGIPEFDLVLLGMGDDGHTASLFPETKALLEDNEIVVLNKVPQLQSERITITYPLILNSKEIIVIIKGESKEKIISELYGGESFDYPILKVAKLHSNLKWLIA